MKKVSPFKVAHKRKKGKKGEVIRVTGKDIISDNVKIVNKRKTPLKRQITPEYEEVIDRIVKNLANTRETAKIDEWVTTINNKVEELKPLITEEIQQRDLSIFGIKKSLGKKAVTKFNEEIWLYTEHNIPPVYLFLEGDKDDK